jgi:hypothetical protein
MMWCWSGVEKGEDISDGSIVMGVLVEVGGVGEGEDILLVVF